MSDPVTAPTDEALIADVQQLLSGIQNSRKDLERARAAFDELASRLQARAQETGWQPIETATDNVIVLVYDDGYIGKAVRQDGRWLDVEVGRDDAWFDPTPTHWQPLPGGPR